MEILTDRLKIFEINENADWHAITPSIAPSSEDLCQIYWCIKTGRVKARKDPFSDWIYLKNPVKKAEYVLSLGMDLIK